MKVTIAIPFYNAEKYLADAIQSVFAQTHQEWELILIDDGSTDNSLNIAQSINDPRVRVISDGKNKKLAARLNEITELANYEFIARMDADDLILPDRIAQQLKYLKENPVVDLVSTGVFSVMNDLSLKGIRGQNFHLPSFEDIISRRKGIIHASIVARKSWYQRNKYDETIHIAQDLELWIRASYAHDFKVMAIETPLYIYREEDNVTGDKLLRAYRNERSMISKYQPKGYKLLLKSHLKSTLVRLLMLTGSVGLLQKRRANAEISSDDKLILEKAIQTIYATPLPIKE